MASSTLFNKNLRLKQISLYRDMVNKWKSGDVLIIPNLDPYVASSVISIEVSQHCSCGRFFEQHPTFFEDTDEENLEFFLQCVLNGTCKCLTCVQSQSNETFTEVGKSFIHVAAALGSVRLTEQLVCEAGVDINSTTSLQCFTPLSLAVMQTRNELVKWLCDQPHVEKNIKSRREKLSPLLDALMSEKYHLVEILVQARGIDLNVKNFRDETPLIVAVLMRNFRLVRILLEAGADHSIPNTYGVMPLMLAINSGHEVMREFVRARVPLDTPDCDGDTALIKSIACNNFDVVNILVLGGANPLANPASPALILAARLGHLRIMALLLDIGEDPDQTDEWGWTALHYVCLKGFIKMVSLLLSHKAKPDGSSKNVISPLGLTIFHGHIHESCLLVENGANVNHADEYLNTPLHFAAYHGDVGAVEFLLAGGAKACTYNSIGATPLFNAVVSNDAETVKLLIPHYTDVDMKAMSRGFRYLNATTSSIFFPCCEKSILWIAASNTNLEIAMLLSRAGYDASNDDWISQGCFPDQGRSFDPAKAQQLKDHLIDYASRPRDLITLCRASVRQALGSGNQRKINCICIPRKIKNYIMLRDL